MDADGVSKSCPGCGGPLPPGASCPSCSAGEESTYRLDLRAAMIAERYRLLRRLGEGGMGEVWLAHDTRLDAEVALKFIVPRWSGSSEALSRFHREILIARRIRHPNVAAVYDLFEHDERTFFTMEFVPGPTLEERLEQPFSVEEVLAVARDLCAGLASLHQAGIVHRDIKPRNIKITPEGRAVLLDLGIAKDTSRPDTTDLGLVIGTPDHMAPEQALGRPVSPATDVFAVGLTVYRMLAGVRPPVALSAVSRSEWAAIKRPSEHNPAVPAWLDRVTMACLDPDPRRRYANAALLLEDLEAERRRTTGQTVTLSRRSLAGVSAAVVVTAALLAVAGAWLWLSGRRPAPLQAHRLTTAAGLECGGTLSPDRRLLVYSRHDGSSFDLVLATAGQEAEPLRLLATPESDELDASLSPNGTLLAFASVGARCGIGVMPVTGGGVRWVLPAGCRPRWSPDGGQLAVQSGNGEPPALDIVIRDADGSGEPVSLRQRFGIASSIHDADWWSASELLAVVGGREVHRFDLASGVSEKVLDAPAPLRHLAADAARREAAFLMEGADGWQPYRWRMGSAPESIGSGGYRELTGWHDGALLLTRSEAQMLILSAELGVAASSPAVETRPASAGVEQREYMPDLSADGRWLAFISSRSGQPQVWLKETASGAVRQVSEGNGDHRWPSFSPDSRLLAYCSKAMGGGDILVYDLAQGSTTNLTDSPSYDGAPDWFPDGRSLAINVKRDGRWDLARVEWPSGRLTLLTGDPEVDIDPAVSPDGRTVAFHRDGFIHCLAIEDGSITRLIPGSTPRWGEDGRELLYQADGDLWALELPPGGRPPRRLTRHPWTARHLEGVWKFSARRGRVIYSVMDYPSGDIVLLAPPGESPR